MIPGIIDSQLLWDLPEYPMFGLRFRSVPDTIWSDRRERARFFRESRNILPRDILYACIANHAMRGQSGGYLLY